MLSDCYLLSGVTIQYIITTAERIGSPEIYMGRGDFMLDLPLHVVSPQTCQFRLSHDKLRIRNMYTIRIKLVYTLYWFTNN